MCSRTGGWWSVGATPGGAQSPLVKGDTRLPPNGAFRRQVPGGGESSQYIPGSCELQGTSGFPSQTLQWHTRDVVDIFGQTALPSRRCLRGDIPWRSGR